MCAAIRQLPDGAALIRPTEKCVTHRPDNVRSSGLQNMCHCRPDKALRRHPANCYRQSLILIKHRLDLLRIFGLSQRQLQQYAGLLRVQRTGGNETVLRIIDFRILSG